MRKVLFLFFSSLFALEGEEPIWNRQAPSVQEYNSALQQAIAANDWWSAIDYAGIISHSFPASPFAQEAPYVMGEVYYKLNQLEYANQSFTDYLNHATAPKHFEAAIEYKFTIAEQFANGVKKRLFNSPKMPAWLPAQEDAIPIYDDVIAAMPHSELAVQSLLGKARVQAYLEDFKPGLETLDVLIRRFPKHTLAAEAYLEKTKLYLAQCKAQNLDPDILDLAEVNNRKFRLAFPRESRLQEAETVFAEIQEVFAQNLLKIGRFFEKTKKQAASQIYYNTIIAKYPNTDAAAIARQKLAS
jgi:outer membrane protein assembly factor BamD (BamD/ComL family)